MKARDLLLPLLLVAVLATGPSAAGGIIETVSGNFNPEGAPAIEVPLDRPRAVAVDGTGNVFLAFEESHRVLRVDGEGRLFAVAGNGTYGFSGDGGPATEAQLATPSDVIVDSAGGVIIADWGNARVRRIAADGTIATIAGNGTLASGGDGGPALKASVMPLSIAIDGKGNLYIGELARVRRVNRRGIITTVAGTGRQGFSGDGGPAVRATIRVAGGLAVDSFGHLFIGETDSHRIRRVDPRGTITTVAGTGRPGFRGDGGSATAAQLHYPYGLAVDAADNVYVADSANLRIRRIDRTGRIATVVGNGDYVTEAGLGDGGPATEAGVGGALDVAVGPRGLYYPELDTRTARTVDPAGILNTLAGNGELFFYGEGIAAVDARLYRPTAVAGDGAGSLYVADHGSARIRQIDGSGTITTVAGNGQFDHERLGLGDGGPATEASLSYEVFGLAADAIGNLYISDTGSLRVRRVEPSGIITTVAGTGEYYPEDGMGEGGPATEAHLAPLGLVAASDGGFFVVDLFTDTVRHVDPAGVITTFAGTGGPGFDGDGGPATAATLDQPWGLATDPAGRLYIADSRNNRVRRVDADGVITTVAGNGEPGFDGDGGPAVAAKLDWPIAVSVDAGGNLFISDQGNSRIRRVDPRGVITTVAGNGEYGFSGDGGPALEAELGLVQGLAATLDDVVYLAGTTNDRIRRVRSTDDDEGTDEDDDETADGP